MTSQTMSGTNIVHADDLTQAPIAGLAARTADHLSIAGPDVQKRRHPVTFPRIPKEGFDHL